MLRYTLVLMVSFMLSGCALTRVSDATHAKEVNQLDVIGLTLDEARESAIRHGYECSTHPKLNVTVATESGNRKSNTLECDKASAEVFCPQRRIVVFNADVGSGKVYAVGKRITQNSCF